MDPQLTVRAQGGDEQAFADLTVAMGGRKYRTAYGILRDRGSAEAAMQAALVQIWRKLPKLRDAASFEAWSTKLLVHACYAESKCARGGLLGLVRWRGLELHTAAGAVAGLWTHHLQVQGAGIPDG